jgi:hypothetical protein
VGQPGPTPDSRYLEEKHCRFVKAQKHIAADNYVAISIDDAGTVTTDGSD